MLTKSVKKAFVYITCSISGLQKHLAPVIRGSFVLPRKRAMDVLKD